MKTNLIITSLLAVVLLSGVFFSLAAAQDDSAPPDQTIIQDPVQVDAPDNSTLTQDDDAILYTRMDENNTAPQREPAPEVPGVEDANLFAAQTGSDNNLLIVAGAVILAVVVGALGVLCWRRESSKK
jgi:hypothetical protein